MHNYKKLYKLATAILFIFTAIEPTWAAPKKSPSIPKVACIDNASGVITLRKKCKNIETRLSSASYKSGIDSLEASLTSANTNISSITAGLATSNSNISTLQSDLNSTNSNISTLQSDLNATISNVSTLTSGLSTSIANIATLQTSVSNLRPSKVYTVSATGADYTTIASAVAAAVADGVSFSQPALIKINPGTYYLSEQVTIGNGIKIIGSGREHTTLEVVNDDGAFLINGNVEIQDLQINAIRATCLKVIELITTIGFNTLTMNNVLLNVSLDNNGVAIDNDNSELLINNSEIDFSTSAATSVAIKMTNSTRAEFFHLNIQSQGGDTNTGILVQDTSHLYIRNSFIEGSAATQSTIIQWTASGDLKVAGTEIISSGALTSVLKINNGYAEILRSDIRCEATNTEAGCIDVDGSLLDIRPVIMHSRIESISDAVRVVGSQVNIRHSDVLNTITGVGGGTPNCLAITNQLGQFLPTGCAD